MECELTSRTGSARRILGDLKKSVSWVESCLRRRRLTFACLRRPCDGCARVVGGGGGRWKNQNRKNVYISPYVEEPLKSKVIKSFVPELRSRKCFSCFKIPMFYVYMLWTLHVRFPYSYMAMVYLKPFNCVQKNEVTFVFEFQFLTQSKWIAFPHPVVLSFVLFLPNLLAFAYKVIDRFLFICVANRKDLVTLLRFSFHYSIHDLFVCLFVCFCFMAYQPLQFFLMPNPFLYK